MLNWARNKEKEGMVRIFVSSEVSFRFLEYLLICILEYNQLDLNNKYISDIIELSKWRKELGGGVCLRHRYGGFVLVGGFDVSKE